MQSFINLIFNFCNDFYNSIVTYFTNNNNIATLNNFMAKNILDGTLINLGLTWHELIVILIPVGLAIFFIILIFALFRNIIGLFVK